MAVDMPYRPEMVVRGVERVLDRPLVGLVVANDAFLHLRHRKLAAIDRLSRVEHAPDEADAKLGLAAGHCGPGPRGVHEGSVDVEQRSVGIDVAARKARGDEGGTQARTRAVQLVDKAVLGLAQRFAADGGAKILGIVGAAVRRIEHERNGVARGMDQREGWIHAESFRWQADMRPGPISASRGASTRQRAKAFGQRGW